MLQFITGRSKRFTIAEEAQMVMEGGCRWIQLSRSVLNDNEENVRDAAVEIIELCKEHEAFLIIEDDICLVEDLKVHGLFMHDSSRESVMVARERLGADAVIGVAVSSAAEALHLVGLDVDYITLSVDAGCDDKVAFFADVTDRLMDANICFHVVAAGDVQPADFESLLKAGCSGVAVCDQILEADDPVSATRALISSLEDARRIAEAEIG